MQETSEEASEKVNNPDNIVDLTENPINADGNKSFESTTTLELLTEDISTEVLNPNKIHRTFKLRMHGSDPKQCYELLDDMYNIYYENEVKFSFYLVIRVDSLCLMNTILKSNQEKYAAKPYMDRQPDLNYKMRSILIDWLVEVHHKYKLQTSTLWLCVNLIDRYLSIEIIKRGKLQLVGVAALFISCKFEEVYPPESKDFVHITDNAYTHSELLKMETDILNTLNYEVLVPTGFHFLSRYLNCIKASDNTRMLANYYAERNLQEGHILEVKPRVVAASAIYAALKQQEDRYIDFLYSSKETCWNKTLQEESNLKESDLLVCARLLIKYVGIETETTSKRKLIAAKKKYSTDRFHNVALLDEPDI